KDVVQPAIEALRPPVKAAGHFNELDGYAQPIVRLSHAAFEQAADAEMPADGANIRAGGAELKRRGPRRDTKAVDLGERVDQLLREAFAEVVLVAVAAHVRERQHGDGGEIGRGRRSIRARVGVEAGQGGDEPVAAAVPRLDEARLPGVVLERPAQLLDARGQRIVAHGSAAPYRCEKVVL